MVAAVERAVAFFEDLPQETVVAELPDRDVVVRPSHWREALETCEETQHVPRRTELLAALGELLSAPEVSRHPVVVGALRASWPNVSAAGLITDLLTHRGLLAHCAPGLTAEERAAIRAHATGHDGWHLTPSGPAAAPVRRQLPQRVAEYGDVVGGGVRVLVRTDAAGCTASRAGEDATRCRS